MPRLVIQFLVLIFLVGTPAARAINFIFDYTYDTGGFFTAERRTVVDFAATSFSQLAIDRPALIPSGPNDWSWNFSDPSTGNPVSLANPSIGEGELRVFLGARILDGPLGLGGNVGYGASGTAAWIDSLEETNTAAAYRPFGGVIAMDADAVWYSGLEAAVPPGQFDLYSVLAHELGHVLGVGIAEAWDTWADAVNDTFLGPNAVSIYGDPIPLENDLYHFASGTNYLGDSFIMVPAIASGVRREWTAPELAALLDLGYQPIPEPGTLTLLLLAALFLSRHRFFNPSRPLASRTNFFR